MNNQDYNCIQGASSTQCDIMVVDNPNLDLILALFLFSFWFFGIYWMFSKKR